MSFTNPLVKFLLTAQTIEPGSCLANVGYALGWFFTWIWQGICLGIYNTVRWLLALVDFMQYFIQKLIGLDYWLNRTYYTLEGAIESDIIFGFLYNDTVQKVFRAIMAVFFVLLIIFTIYAIIRQEWRYITGKEFGNGTGNSKGQIIRESLKAVAIVLILPIMLMIGIISANAILASLIKALNIDTSSTLGGQLFQIASQNANRYEKYARRDEGRSAVSDEVSFYIYDGKYLSLSMDEVDTELVEKVTTYEAFLEKAAESTKYTVNTVFNRVVPGSTSAFYGYCAMLEVDGKSHYIMVECDTEGTEHVNDKDAYGYYLRNVLQVPIVTSTNGIGFGNASDLSGKIGNDGYIDGYDLTGIKNGDDITDACHNTWNYASIYRQTNQFEDAEDYVITKSGNTVPVTLTTDGLTTTISLVGQGSDRKEFISEALGLGVTNAKIMYNSNQISQYFDGGQQGVVQMQAEYLVMGEVVSFINENNFRLHMLDITSSLIDWSGEDSYYVDSKWISTGSSGVQTVNMVDSEGITKETLPFVIAYSDACNETEMGNVLYFGDKNVGGTAVNNEVRGSKYIMCIKVEGAGNARYIPLVNNKTYKDPVTGKMYNFKSTYYAPSYKGVVLAKGLLDAGASDAFIGSPTYLSSSYQTQRGEIAGENIPYYYDMQMVGGFNQYAENATVTDDNYLKFNVEAPQIDLKGENTGYLAKSAEQTGVANADTEYWYEIYQITKQSNGNQTEQKIVPGSDIIRNMTISTKIYKADGTLDSSPTASYSGISYGAYHMFTFNKGSDSFYFLIYVDPTSGDLKIQSYDRSGDKWGAALGMKEDDTVGDITAITHYYNVKYDYVGQNKVGADIELLGESIINNVTPNYFSFTEQKNGKAIYTTLDMQLIQNSAKNFEKSLYVNVAFNTNSASLVSLSTKANGDISVNFATAYEPSYTGATTASQLYQKRSEDKNVQRSSAMRLYLYDFYTASVNGSLYRYNMRDGTTSAAVQNTENGWCLDFTINSNTFSFPKEESYIHLYNGKKYVITVYKLTDSRDESFAIADMSQLDDKSIYVYDGNNTYYNVDSQNAFTSEDAMKTHFAKVKDSAVIQCRRANLSTNFWGWDFGFVSLIPFRVRVLPQFFFDTLNTDWVGHEFYLSNGIQFDYFFEGENSLMTFYIPGNISYWILVIASALMIKVLGTAIWGVIKRIYEIVLYYLAAPAVASTIPLDEGRKFQQTIQQELIRKVLGTYGVMLGINVFFILLYPVKTLSQIFTAEDIAVSNSYFLKNFFGFLPYELKASLLNMYVYILFVLVAFTMISSMPKIISTMVGGEDMVEQGEKTKGLAKKSVQGAMDMASGKSLVEGAGKLKESFTSGAMMPFGALAKKGVELGKGAVDWVKDKFTGGVPDESSGSEESTEEDESSRKGEGDEATEQVQNAIDSKVAEATGFATYEEAMANGDENQRAQAQAAREEAEQEIMNAEGNEEQKAALQKMKEAEAAGEEGTEGEEEGAEGDDATDPVEAEARDQMNGSIEETAAVLGGDVEEMKANTARNMAGSGNATLAKAATAAIAATGGAGGIQQALLGGNGKAGMMTPEMKKQAILSTMADGAEKDKFAALEGADLDKALEAYDIQATVGADGQLGLQVGKKGADGKVAEYQNVSKQATNDIVGQVMQTQDENGNYVISNAAITEAVSNTEGADKEVTRFAAQNVAATIDFSSTGSDSIADHVMSAIEHNPEDEQAGAVVDKAALAALNDPANKDARKEFMRHSGLSAEDMKDETKVLAAIAEMRKGGSLTQIIPEDKIKGHMGEALQESVQNGTFKMTAWDVYKASDETLAETYREQVAAEHLTRTNEQAELEKKKSEELVAAATTREMLKAAGVDGVENMTPEQLAEAKDNLTKRKIAEAAGIAGADKMSPEDLDKAIKGLDPEKRAEAEKKVTADMASLEATATGKVLFDAYAEAHKGDTSGVGDLLTAYAGLGDEAGIAAALDASKGWTPEKINELILTTGYSRQELAQAAEASKLLGGNGSVQEALDYLVKSKENPEEMNSKLMEAMKNGDPDKLAKAYEVVGSGADVAELTEMAVADGSLMLSMMSGGDLDKITDTGIRRDVVANAYKDNLDDVLKSIGVDITGMGEEEKLAALKGVDEDTLNILYENLDPEKKKSGLEAVTSGMSAYEVSQLLEGKSRAEVLTGIQEESKKAKVVAQIAENGNFTEEEMMEAVANTEGAEEAMADEFSRRAHVLSRADEAAAERRATREFLAETYGVEIAEGEDAYAKIYEATGGDVAALEAETTAKVNGDLKDQILAGKNKKKYNTALEAWLKKNRGKNEADFLASAESTALLAGLAEVDAAGVESLREKTKNAIVEDAVVKTPEMRANLERAKSVAVESENMRQLVEEGAYEKAAFVAETLSSDKKVMSDAAALFAAQTGQSWDKADEITRNTFLYANFRDRLTEAETAEMESIGAAAATTAGSTTERSAAIMEKLKENPELFMDVYENLDSVDLGTDAGEGIKAKVMETAAEAAYDKYGGKIDVAANPETMSENKRKRYEANLGVLQKEIRSNPDAIGNLFKNSTIMNQEAMIQEIALAQGLITRDENGKLVYADGENKGKAVGESVEDMNALKAQLDNSAIADYMNKHEKTKTELLSIGAQDMMKALDTETQQAKNAEAVLGSAYLRNQVADTVIKEAGLDDAQVRDLIRQMLLAQGKEKEANDDNYITNHFKDLKTELSLHEFTKGADGKVTLGERNSSAFVAAIDKAAESSPLFASTLNREVTKVLDPTRQGTDGSEEFFAKRSISGYTHDGKPIESISDALDVFYDNNGFGGFNKGVQNIAGDKYGGMTTGGFRGGLKTILFGGAGEGKEFSSAIGRDGDEGGLLGGLKSIGQQGILGSVWKAVSFKSARSVVDFFKGYHEDKVHGDNLGFGGYLASRLGIAQYKRDENGKIVTDENGKPIKLQKGDEGYESGWKRFGRVANAVLDNTAVGSLIKHTSLGVAKMSTGLALGVAKMATGAGMGIARMATGAWNATVGNAYNFITTGRRAFKKQDAESMRIVEAAKQNKAIMQAVGPNATYGQISLYLERNKDVKTALQQQVYAEEARKDETITQAMVEAGVDVNDTVQVSEFLSRNKKHRTAIQNKLKSTKMSDIANGDAEIQDEIKKNVLNDAEFDKAIEESKVDVKVGDAEVIAEARKSSFIKAHLGENASDDEILQYLNRNGGADYKKFENAAKRTAVRADSGKLQKVLQHAGKVDREGNLTEDAVKGYFASNGARRVFQQTDASVMHRFVESMGTTFGVIRSGGKILEAAGNFFKTVGRKGRVFKKQDAETLRMIETAREDSEVIKAVGANATAGEISMYLDKHKAARERVRMRVYAKEAVSGNYSAISKAMKEAHIDQTDHNAVARFLAENPEHLTTIKTSLKNRKMSDVVKSDYSQLGTEIKKNILSDDEMDTHIEELEKSGKMSVKVKTADVIAEARKSSYVMAHLGENASNDEILQFINNTKLKGFKYSDFEKAAKRTAVREDAGKGGKLETVLKHAEKLDEKGKLTDDAVKEYFSNGAALRTYRQTDSSVAHKFATANGTIFGNITKNGGQIGQMLSNAWGFVTGQNGKVFKTQDIETLRMVEAVRNDDAWLKKAGLTKNSTFGEIALYLKKNKSAEEQARMRVQVSELKRNHNSTEYKGIMSEMKTELGIEKIEDATDEEIATFLSRHKEHRSVISHKIKRGNGQGRAFESTVQGNKELSDEIKRNLLSDSELDRAMSQHSEIKNLEVGEDYVLKFAAQSAEVKAALGENASPDQILKYLGGVNSNKFKAFEQAAKRNYVRNAVDENGNLYLMNSILAQERLVSGKNNTLTSAAVRNYFSGGAALRAYRRSDAGIYGKFANAWGTAFGNASRQWTQTKEAAVTYWNQQVAPAIEQTKTYFAGAIDPTTGKRTGFKSSQFGRQLATFALGEEFRGKGGKMEREGFKKSYLGKTIQTILAPIWGPVRGTVEAAKGIKTGAIVGANAVIFKVAGKLPKQCAQYENWNRIIDHKIAEIKANKTLTRQEKIREIQKLENQKITVEKPQQYFTMTPEQQLAYDNHQDRLKRQAYTDVNLAKYIRTLDRMERAKNPAALGLGTLTHQATTPKDRREKHLADLREARDAIDRFDSTAVMRNKERDFGAEEGPDGRVRDHFRTMALMYMDKKRYIEMMKRYKLKSAFEYVKLSANQKEQERKRREQALRAQLAQIERTLARKVSRDQRVGTGSFLAERNMTEQVVRYNDGSRRYREAQSTLSGGVRVNKHIREDRTPSQITQIQNEAMNIDKMMQEFSQFVSSYKGPSSGFAAEFKKQFAKYGPYAQKIYDKYARSFRGLDVSLDKRPVAVQQRKIMETLAQELSKCKQRITSNGKIPASKEISDLFIAKTFTNATTRAELDLHKQAAEEFNRILALIRQQRGVVSFDSLTRRIDSTHLEDFYKHWKTKLNGKSEEVKKNQLEAYFQAKLDKALRDVHNDTMFRADASKLERLNGKRVLKSSIDHTGVSPVIANAMKTESNPVYQAIVRDVNSATEKVNLERINMEDLLKKLKIAQSKPRTPATIAQISRINQAIKQSQSKLDVLNKVLHEATTKKRDYESAFASSQIKEAKLHTRNLAYNASHSKTLETYEFTRSDGTQVVQGTTDAKQVEMLVSRYVMQYRQSIQSMMKSELIKKSDELRSQIEDVSKKLDDDFGRSLKYSRKIRDQIQAQMERLKTSTKEEDKKLYTKLDEEYRRLYKAEQVLNTRMQQMNIDVSSVRRKK